MAGREDAAQPGTLGSSTSSRPSWTLLPCRQRQASPPAERQAPELQSAVARPPSARPRRAASAAAPREQRRAVRRRAGRQPAAPESTALRPHPFQEPWCRLAAACGCRPDAARQVPAEPAAVLRPSALPASLVRRAWQAQQGLPAVQVLPVASRAWKSSWLVTVLERWEARSATEATVERSVTKSRNQRAKIPDERSASIGQRDRAARGTHR